MNSKVHNSKDSDQENIQTSEIELILVRRKKSWKTWVFAWSQSFGLYNLPTP